MISRATRTIDFAEFYASDAPAVPRVTSYLTGNIEKIEDAHKRGVRVRFLVDELFAPKYPETLEKLARAGVEVRRIDFGKRAGGIHHAKYFVVDGTEAFVGSQNFDWRSLMHIQELGVRVASPTLAGELEDLFETDWAFAGGAPSDARVRTHGPIVPITTTTGERIHLVESPQGWLPDETSWDLPQLVAMIDGAARTIDVQVLTYNPKDRSGAPFTTLDEALRRAAARGVRVRLLVSAWSDKGDAKKALLELVQLRVDVRVITIPPWSGGEIPFARVAHAKYMVVDQARTWIGTSNWEGDYFTKTRNVGVIVEGGALPKGTEQIFEDTWSSNYTKPIAANVKAP